MSNNFIKKELQDPLNETAIPSHYLGLFDHHSPTSTSMPDGIWFFRYGVCSQAERRLFDQNANMASGVAVNNALQWHTADTLWKFHPLTKKLVPVKHKKLPRDEAAAAAIAQYKKYKPCNDKDREKFEHFLDTIPETISQGFRALEKLGVSSPVLCEDVVSHVHDKLELPIIGRLDFYFPTVLSSRHPDESLLSHQLIELKTTWQKPRKLKKDGTRSFSLATLPSAPSINHLQQIAFYSQARPKAEPKLLYVTESDYKIFDKGNCTELEPKNLKKYFDQLVRTAARRERILRRYSHVNNIETIKLEVIKDLDPQFDHNFYWNIGQMWVDKAKEIWNR